MLYVITITLENICEGKEDTKLYQRFFKSIGSAKKQLSELRKKILDKCYNYAFSGKNYHCGDGTLVLGKIDSLVDGQDIDVIIQINRKQHIDYSLKYLEGGSYSLENKEDLKNIKEIKNVQLIIKDDNQKTVYQHTLKLKQVEKLSCSSKTFKVENACISDDFMRLGYLTSTDEDLLKKYPNISLEYRYLKSNKLNDKNDKNYVVFKKINGKTKEIVNQKIYQTYNHDLNQGSLKKKKLSVVIILSKDQSQKSYVFKLNFSKENGGLYE